MVIKNDKFVIKFFKLAAESHMAGLSLKDPMKYRTDIVRHVERFNRAVEHFRNAGHKWPKSDVQGTYLTALSTMNSYVAFEAWILRTQEAWGGHNRMERLPADS